MRLAVAFLCALHCAATAAGGDPVVDRVVDDHALPRLGAFADGAAALAAEAAADCRPNPELKAAWNDALDAWIAAEPYRFGPLDDSGDTLAVAYWPDPKGLAPRSLTALIAEDGPALDGAAAYAEVSVAARGFFALERMLYDPAFDAYGAGSPSCRLMRAAAADLAATAARADAAWTDEFAATLKTAGGPGNVRFLVPAEARQALFAALLAELKFTATSRLDRPLGTLDRARPERAEAVLSGRSLRDVRGSIAAAEDLAFALSDGGTENLQDAFDYALSVADTLDDPVFAGAATTGGRFRLQDLRDAVQRIHDTAIAELGPELGVGAGFNGLEGD